MASNTDTPSASWHPAFMPNSDAKSDWNSAKPQQLDSEPTIDQPPPQEAEEASPQEIPSEATTIGPATTHDGAFLDQFGHDDDPEAGGWDLENPGPSPTSASPEQDKDAQDPDTAGPVDESPSYSSESRAQTKAAKHSSTVSFARTVPHEMNWNDDDDAEWNLQRSDTDPFKFMPPNERTNSFPAVPPPELSYADLEQPTSPPAATQAQEIMQELEQQAQPDLTPQPDFLKTFDHVDAEDQQELFPVGGDMIGAEEDASDARFEEGLPLIPQDEPQLNGEDAKAPSDGFDASFADEAAGGDDFFSHLQDGQNPEAELLGSNPALQRKDTSMFTNIVTSVSNSDPVGHPSDDFDASELGTQIDPESEEQIRSSHGDSNGDLNKEATATVAGESTDVDAKWAAAFGDDEDFLLEDSETKELDPAAFFGSDDEGFLEDEDEEVPTASAPAQETTGVNGRYTPAAVPAQTQPVLNTFNSASNVPQTQQAFPPQYAPMGPNPPATIPYGAPLPKPEASRAQSFADKSKGGYSSPYDLPMDVVRVQPRQRSSMQQVPRANAPLAPPAGPVRSTSLHSQPPPASAVPVSMPSPPSSSGSNLPLSGLKPAPKLTSKSSFFEDLPMSSKPRTATRQNSLPSPQHPPYGQPPQVSHQGPQHGLPQTLSMSPPVQPQVGIAGLVAPERSSPYDAMHNGQARPSAPATTRYSPAPAQMSTAAGMTPPVAAISRYSPAPPSRSNSGAYPVVSPPVLAHQPRTSSPLAHFEVSREKTFAGSGQVPSLTRSASSQYEQRLTRVPSLPPTREVEEDGTNALMQSPPPMQQSSRYSPQQARRTPPPVTSPATTLSPQKHTISNYAPVSQPAVPTREVSFVPPPRSQTQSPGALHGRAPVKVMQASPRPSSAHGPLSPRQTSATQSSRPAVTRARGMSQVLNLVPPTDGRELDPLQRWRGAPSVSWGIGGTMVTSFPKDIPRYGMNQALPMILRSPGEVKLQHIKDVQPIEDRLARFPGPLKGKSKKKETVTWLSQGIESLEKDLPNAAFQQYISHEDKRSTERVLLWKILRVLIENDGTLEGNPTVEKAVRTVLSPELDTGGDESEAPTATMAELQGAPSGIGNLQTDAVDSSALEQIRKHLLIGDREKGAWVAVDKRLWGHAMLIASTVPGDLYKQVSQEFIKKEVNQSGGANESLAALYGVLSGNHEESVDALVPSHARAGLQLMSTSTTSAQSTDALAGLDKWRETLGLILSNRSNNDIVAITSLGNLLSSYGRAEAAHICFMFARKHAVFGGLDDPNVNFVLVGADHRSQADQFAKEPEALLLSEVYEFGLALAGSNAQQSCPHLAAYKLQHAITLSEYGVREKALAYCETIMNAIGAQTKRSPYYHPILESAVADLMGRLKLTPKEGGSSWIPKPSTSSMWDKFNKFVSGDDVQASGQASPGEPGAESGPFARIAGGTPTISRSPSVNNFETFSGPSPAIPANSTSSRYAPMGGQRAVSYDPSSSYASRTSMERSSGEYQRGSLELPRPAQESLPPIYGGSSVESLSTATFGYQPAPTARASSVASSQPVSNYSPYQPTAAQEAPGHSHIPYQPETHVPEAQPEIAVNNVPANIGYGGYEPPVLNTFDNSAAQGEAMDEKTPTAPSTGNSWEPPSFQPYSYEPPTSYEPDPEGGESDTDKPKPKKSFMDDDDDFPSIKSAAPATSEEKSKAEKDRENQEMFRKVAEEEAKRAAEGKSQKKGWLGGWFGGAKKEADMSAPTNKPIRAKLGETSSFIYDPDQKRWVNKKAGADDTPAKTATPPPPRASGTPPPGSSSSAPPMSARTPPPPGGPPMGMPRSVSNLSKMASMDNLRPGPAMGGTPPMARSVSNISNISNGSADSNGPPTLAPPVPSGPPSRPTTSLSNASSIDDLLGAAGPRTKGAKKPRKSGRYVDVMAK
ncbi:Sec23-binding domain of Sec16-domain-containing protein [Truncatella angustata]|uniref:Protein transport protein sec16 n=1 Tax=Truncatella angustata TaxID=152316 RepID=A0A9P8UMZ2_9PEZI|nr:Sec23-binding domain of Sec16-domain-containing protein [Truncatella angustata]KAH6655172.1 Sec23-binding domain of Sec16-domain-containing protein [Truncatella angustata]